MGKNGKRKNGAGHKRKGNNAEGGNGKSGSQAQPRVNSRAYLAAVGCMGLLAAGITFGLYHPERNQQDDRQQMTPTTRSTKSMGITYSGITPRGIQQPALPAYDIRTLPVTYKDVRKDKGTLRNASMQGLLEVAYKELADKRVDKYTGTPAQLELILKGATESLELLTGEPPAFKDFTEQATELVSHARDKLPDLPMYRLPSVRFSIATKDDDLDVMKDFKEVLSQPLLIYVTGKKTDVIKGTVVVRGSSGTNLCLDIENIVPLRGDVNKRGSVRYEQGAIHPALEFSPITHNWEGNTPGAFDNVLGEYFHCVIGPQTVQQASRRMAEVISRSGIPEDHKGLWEECLRHYDILEEAVAHTAAHSVTKQWLEKTGRPQGVLGANYLGTKELGVHCDRVGVRQLLLDFAERPDELMEKSGLKHEMRKDLMEK